MKKTMFMVFAMTVFALNINTSVGCAAEPYFPQVREMNAPKHLPKIIRAKRTIYDENISYRGRVVVSACIDTDGKIASMAIVVSSGDPQCDRMAVKCVEEKWKFAPAVDENGTPVECNIACPIYFNMEPASRIK